MKTLTRIVAVVLVAGLVYFVTVGNNQFYRMIDTVTGVFESIAKNYLRK